MRNTRDLFAHLFVLGETRQINHAELMSYPLVAFPLSTAMPDGGLVKTVKSVLIKKLEELVDPVDITLVLHTRYQLTVQTKE